MLPRRRVLHLLGAGLAIGPGCLGDPGTTTTAARTRTRTETRSATATSTETGSPTRTAGTHPDARWARRLPGPVVSRPLFHDGTLYVGAGRALLAIDPADGTVRWRFRAPNSVALRAMSGSGLRVAGGHLLAVSGRFDGLHGQENAVHAVDPSAGTERWRYAPGDSYTSFGLLPAADGAVYVGSNDDAIGPSGDETRALSLADGSERWRTETGDVTDGAPAGGSLYVAAAGRLYALAAGDGAERWHRDTDSYLLRVATGPDVVYLQSGHGEGIAVALAPADGSERWRPSGWSVSTMRGVPDGDVVFGGDRVVRFAPDGSVRWRNDGGGFVADVPIKSGRLFVSRRGAVVALGLDGGERRWGTETGFGQVAPQAAGGDAVVSVGGDPRTAVVHDAATGQERWRATLGDRAPEPIVGDGAAFFVAPDGQLVARDL